VAEYTCRYTVAAYTRASTEWAYTGTLHEVSNCTAAATIATHTRLIIVVYSAVVLTVSSGAGAFKHQATG
jgi:hypothetical protein